MISLSFLRVKTIPEKSKMDISEITLDIVKSAVTLAKNEQITTVDLLRNRLLSLYPNNQENINKAIKLWANHPT